MKYFKIAGNEFISCIGKVNTEQKVFGEITEEEYVRLLNLIAAKPEEPKGYLWRLRRDETWTLVAYEAEEVEFP